MLSDKKTLKFTATKASLEEVEKGTTASEQTVTNTKGNDAEKERNEVHVLLF